MNAHMHHFEEPNPGRDLLRALHDNPLDVDHTRVATERDAARRLFKTQYGRPVRHGSFMLGLVAAATYGLSFSKEHGCHTYRDGRLWNTRSMLRRVIGAPIVKRRCTNPKDIPGALVGVVIYTQTQVEPEFLLVVARFFNPRDAVDGYLLAEPVTDAMHSRITLAGHPLLLEGVPSSISQFVIEK